MAKSPSLGQIDDAKRSRRAIGISAAEKSWDEFFDAPGIDLGSRNQPPID